MTPRMRFTVIIVALILVLVSAVAFTIDLKSDISNDVESVPEPTVISATANDIVEATVPSMSTAVLTRIVPIFDNDTPLPPLTITPTSSATMTLQATQIPTSTRTTKIPSPTMLFTFTPQPTEIMPTPVATYTVRPEVPPTLTSIPTAVPTQQPHNTATPQSTVLATATTTAVSPTQTPTTAPSATSTAVATNTPTLPPPTSTATPTPTATNTPLPSPTNTPTTAGYCPASAGNGRYIINFNNQMIRSDWSEADAQLGPLPTNLSPGTYRISLVSYDPDHALADAAQQPAEKWYLLLQDAENSTIFMSAPTGDLADDQLQQTFVVADEVFIAEGAAFGVAYHAAYPDGSSPNSVYPVCGILEQLAADATPTPMPSATSELLITPNPTVITPHD